MAAREVPLRQGLEETAEVSGAPIAAELARYIGFLIRRVYAWFASQTAGRVVDPRGYAVLAVLEDQTLSQQQLAERLDINRSLIVGLVDRLQMADTVSRAQNPEDRRAYLLSLTPAGKQELADARAAVRAREAQLMPALTAADRSELAELLHRLLPDPSAVPITVGVEYLVSQLHRVLRKRGDDLLAESGLRARHFGPLYGIEKFGPCPQQRLAQYLAITEPAVAQMVDELVLDQLVVRGHDPADRRRSALQLTEAGREQLRVVTAAVDRMQAGLVEVLGAKDDERLRTLLERVLPVADASTEVQVQAHG